jgi:hypothetical protein
MFELPEINTSAIDAVFSILSKMEVDLDEDPLQFGPKRLNFKVAETRRLLTDCESLFLKISQWLQKYRAAYRTLEVELDLDKKQLFANDPEVRAGRNVADRDALATMKLREKAQAISKVAQTQADLESLLAVVKAKRMDLKDLQTRLRDQINLCREEIGLGGKWGSKTSPEASRVDLDSSPNVDKKTLKDLQNMFLGASGKEPDLSSVVFPEPDPVPVQVVESGTGPISAEDEPESAGESEAEESDTFHSQFSGKTSDWDSDSFLEELSGTYLAESNNTSKPSRSVEDLLNDLDL